MKFIFKVMKMLMNLVCYQDKNCCKLNTARPRYMRSFYQQFCIYKNEKLAFSGTYPLIYGDLRSFYMQIHYMRAYFWSPYLWHITRCTRIVVLEIFSTMNFCCCPSYQEYNTQFKSGQKWPNNNHIIALTKVKSEFPKQFISF